MPDDELDDKLDAATLPAMSEMELRTLIGNLTAVAMTGATRIEIHPARWRWMLDNILNHGAFPAEHLHWLRPMKGDAEDYKRCAVPLMFTTADGIVTCLLMSRQDHDDEGKHGEVIDGQARCYAVPEPEDEVEAAAKRAGLWIPPKDTLQ